MSTTTSYHLKVLAQSGMKAELEADGTTTIAELRQVVFHALGIQPDPSVLWFFQYRGEQLNSDTATLAEILGDEEPDKQVVLHFKKQPFAGAQAPAPEAPEPTRSYIQQSLEELRARSEELAIRNIQVEGVDVYVTILARDLGAGRDPYTVRLCCTGYDVEPPSVTLVDPTTLALATRAWPNVPSGPGAIFRPNAADPSEAFVCTPGTREWYSHGHGEFHAPEHWRLARIIEAIHFGLNSSGYQGRCEG